MGWRGGGDVLAGEGITIRGYAEGDRLHQKAQKLTERKITTVEYLSHVSMFRVPTQVPHAAPGHSPPSPFPAEHPTLMAVAFVTAGLSWCKPSL